MNQTTVCQQNSKSSANKGVCYFTFTELLSTPLHSTFSTDPILSYEFIILLILLEKIGLETLFCDGQTKTVEKQQSFLKGLQHSTTLVHLQKRFPSFVQ